MTLDKNGNLQCPHCQEWTNPAYVFVENLTCWSCGGQILKSHGDTINKLMIKLYPKLEHYLSEV